jgi:transcriptional regulator with XRE-family HTH domain
MAETPTHLGRKISRLRELRGMKQETLAEQLGISQQAVSKIEQSENVEEHTLERIAKALSVTPNAIKSFSEDIAINFFNTFNESTITGAGAFSNNSQCSFNPLDKYIEAVEKNEKLYEALLKSEREKIALLERLLEKK